MLGERGEEHARASLEKLGLRCAGRRVRTARGEVDLVFWSERRLLCVEVKAGRWVGPGARFEPGKHFAPAQRRRLQASGDALAHQLTPGKRAELALFEVWFDADGRVVRERLSRLRRTGR